VMIEEECQPVSCAPIPQCRWRSQMVDETGSGDRYINRTMPVWMPAAHLKSNRYSF
jgi:hypothetical protein